jgi:hypothetical protein
VSGAALTGLARLDRKHAYELAKKYSGDAKGTLGDIVTSIFIGNGSESDYDFIANKYNQMPPGQDKFEMTDMFCEYLSQINDMDKIKSGINAIIKFANIIPEQYKTFTDPAIRQSLGKISKAKGQDVRDYISQNWK